MPTFSRVAVTCSGAACVSADSVPNGGSSDDGVAVAEVRRQLHPEGAQGRRLMPAHDHADPRAGHADQDRHHDAGRSACRNGPERAAGGTNHACPGAQDAARGRGHLVPAYRPFAPSGFRALATRATARRVSRRPTRGTGARPGRRPAGSGRARRTDPARTRRRRSRRFVPPAPDRPPPAPRPAPHHAVPARRGQRQAADLGARRRQSLPRIGKWSGVYSMVAAHTFRRPSSPVTGTSRASRRRMVRR